MTLFWIFLGCVLIAALLCLAGGFFGGTDDLYSDQYWDERRARLDAMQADFQAKRYHALKEEPRR